MEGKNVMKKMWAFLKCVGILGVLVLTINFAQAQESEKDHAVLRQMLKIGTEALNTGNIDAFKRILNEPFFITTSNQKTFTDLNGFKSYYNDLFSGPNAPLKSLSLDPKAEIKTAFITENVGLCYGISNDTFVFKNGKSKKMLTKWTATVVKNNNDWKLANLHLAIDAFDNPMLKSMQETIYLASGISFFVGLIFLWAVMFFIRKNAA